jgi:DNA-binding XRE family transcriptional regulator
MMRTWLIEARKNKNLSQAQLGKPVGVSAQAISNYERGKRSPRDLDGWGKLATALGLSVEMIFEFEDSRKGGVA